MNTLWWWLSNGPLGFFTSAIINMPIYKARFYTRFSNSLSRWRQCDDNVTHEPVYDDHVEVVPVVILHLSSSLDDVLQLVVVHLLQVVHLPTLQLGRRIFSFTEFGNNQKFSRRTISLECTCCSEGGATKTTYGIRSELFRILSDCKGIFRIYAFKSSEQQWQEQRQKKCPIKVIPPEDADWERRFSPNSRRSESLQGLCRSMPSRIHRAPQISCWWGWWRFWVVEMM